MRLFLVLLVLVVSSCATVEPAFVVDIEKTIIKKQLEEGVSIEDAIDSLKLRANLLNMNLVAELPLSNQIEAMGQSSQHISIYQFCDPLMAKKMVEHDIDFAAYLPCRISVVEDKNGQAWLVMMNLDMLLSGLESNSALKKDALHVRDTLMEIMNAGASGDL